MCAVYPLRSCCEANGRAGRKPGLCWDLWICEGSWRALRALRFRFELPSETSADPYPSTVARAGAPGEGGEWYAVIDRRAEVSSLLWSACALNPISHLQSKKKGLSIDEKKVKVLEIFHETRDVFQLKVGPVHSLTLPAVAGRH